VRFTIERAGGMPLPEEVTASILVVDDDIRNLYAFDAILGELGQNVVTARSGDEALLQLLDREFAVILMDVQMPGLDGYETAEMIRARERCRGVPIIFVTAYNKDDDHIFRGYESGAVDYIFKPVDPLVLRSKVAVFVELYRKTEEIRRQAAFERALLQENFRVRAEKLRSERALRRHERQYGVIIRSLPLVLYTTAGSRFGECGFVSENVEAITGFPAPRFIGDADFWRERIHPEDRARAEAEFAALGERGTVSSAYRWLCADGSERCFIDHAVVAREGRGRGSEVYGTWLDVTDRRQLELQLNRAQRLEAIGRLTGGIAHDFNNMLSVVIGNLDRLYDGAQGQPKLERYTDLALKGAMRCADLTRRLLAFARRQPLEASLIQLDAFAADIADLLRRTLTDRVELVYRAEPDLAIVADPAQVEAALLNLVFNARDAMPEGGRIDIDLFAHEWSATDPARPTECAPGRYVGMRIADTGMGMPPEVQARAFEPFFTTKGVGHGTGLGLSTTYGFVTQLGGGVVLESEPGSGTSVTLYFPAADEAAAPDDDAAPAGEETPLHGVVLVVEDDDDVRAVAVACLGSLALDVLEAADGPAALAALESNREIDLLFTDLAMPGMSGRELAAEARRRRPDLKVLYVSGFDEGELTASPGEVLRKPYRSQDLASRIREILSEPAG
jgi:CheY-like chemotaxis protein/nitrogen-specific signal transduction histidine kinase